MMTRPGFQACLALLGVFFVLPGCAKSKNTRNATEDRLYAIGKAYIQSCYRLERAPENFADIKESVEGEIPDDLLVSPRDGEKFVILWGVDFSQLQPPPKDPFTVGGYEKIGVNGSRYVLRFPLSITTMTDEEFGQARFPTGHKKE